MKPKPCLHYVEDDLDTFDWAELLFAREFARLCSLLDSYARFGERFGA